ncbi:hypothetical protein CEUSTIGMA_g10143.t1 [Chlamydomonas eustigma]|uniref:Uncharacterized protein n=1 Tax=Chlamydomonas eustigma TaxID=1157962 RepID=A0A250XI04_9CHLO|nr:hypothetical protein CEUSTIGMA_g10143.t1 [Chlamydomonas eustigma]|eukprot:GAX82717.1 hypothetical protein CEUSTIGMA_g10143.t1 [Chlamydomonas eustigma]
MSSKRRNIRTKRETDEIESGGGPEDQAGPKELRTKLEETKLIQKQRRKFGGVDAEKLSAANGPLSMIDEIPENTEADTGAKLMDSYVKATTVRQTDEDPQMNKFIEMELSRRLGKRSAEEEVDEGEKHRRRVEKDLYSIPDHLQSVQQEVSLPGLMTGISEVVVPLEERLKRIEETEAAKRQILAAASRRAHIPMEEERLGQNEKDVKMRRSALPIVFGKPEVRRVDRDPEEMEGQRRRVVTQNRPLAPLSSGRRS